MSDIGDNPDLASDLSAIAMYVIKSNDPGTHGKLQEAFAAALAPFEDENRRLRASLQECLEIVDRVYDKRAYRALKERARAALRSTEASHDD